ncbi:AraC family transcriptional regulator [Paenibacillus sp. R14(2021)]|uniref:helix-turn-helix transcriptional regulator n=1 Tax=Paenibacillus sp. R14(2021) TaxID=2859228 RepID=UPI001C61546F|nr:AraC family transcriptional regulator [Paenibacillus sp. R14(2021)]
MGLRLLIHNRYLRIEHIATNHQKKRIGTLNSRHRHPVFHLMYILDGEGSFHLNDRVTRAMPGCLYIISPNEWHQFYADEAKRLHNLECTFMLRSEDHAPAEVDFFAWFEEKRGIAVPAALRDEPIDVPVQLRPFLLEGFNRLLDPGNRYVTAEHMSLMTLDLALRVEELLWQLVSSSTSPSSEGGAKEIAVLQQYMAAHLGDAVQLEQLARLVHWTPNYLCRVFKTRTGCTPLAYLQRLRMTEAEKLLLYTDLPVFTVADMLGYEDPSYFARLFKRYYGRAPSVYRTGG